MPDSDDIPAESDASERRVSSGDEAARAIQEVLKDQAERKARQEDAVRDKQKKRLLPLPLVALLWGVACLVVWAATPQFLLPEPVPEPSPAQVEAGLRMEMVSLVAEIDSYEEQTGRVPESLDRVVEDVPSGVRYTAFADGSFRLVGVRAGNEIIYQSGDPVDDLVGPARRQIETGSDGDEDGGTEPAGAGGGP